MAGWLAQGRPTQIDESEGRWARSALGRHRRCLWRRWCAHHTKRHAALQHGCHQLDGAVQQCRVAAPCLQRCRHLAARLWCLLEALLDGSQRQLCRRCRRVLLLDMPDGLCHLSGGQPGGAICGRPQLKVAGKPRPAGEAASDSCKGEQAGQARVDARRGGGRGWLAASMDDASRRCKPRVGHVTAPSWLQCRLETHSLRRLAAQLSEEQWTPATSSNHTTPNSTAPTPLPHPRQPDAQSQCSA